MCVRAGKRAADSASGSDRSGVRMLGVVDTRIEREEKRVESGVSIGFLKRKGERRKKRRNFPRVKNSREFSLFVKAIDHSKRRVVFLTKATVI